VVTEVSDLEPLLGRFDPGLILVGPLVFTYRYFDIAGNESNIFQPDLIVVGPLSFDIAGNGSKVYQIVNLGFGKVETNASGQHAKFIEKLESRFAEVMTFGSQLEMANAVHERWPNEETAKVLAFTNKILAFAVKATKSEPTKTAGHRGHIDDSSFAGALRGDCGKPLVDAREPADDAKDIDAVSKHPSEQLGGDPALTQRQRHSSPSEEIAGADLKWDPSVQLREITKPRLGRAQSFASITLRSCAVAAAIALVAWSLSVHRDYAPPAAAPPSVRSQQVKANEPTPSESALLTMVPQPLPSQPSQAKSTQAVSAPLSAPAQGNTALMRPPVALLLGRATDFFAQGDYAAARPLLQRAAEAGSASAALMLGATFDPLVVHPIGGTGIKPDTTLARQWYEKAVELGSETASQQLARLMLPEE
jgi:hypothetical protein